MSVARAMCVPMCEWERGRPTPITRESVCVLVFESERERERERLGERRWRQMYDEGS